MRRARSLLLPFSAVTSAVTAARMRGAGWYCPIPVICVGNATMGGAGKTTVVLDLARRLQARRRTVHILLRGYGGSSRGLHFVRTEDSAALVGDEALLHASVAPTWTCADRRQGAQAIVAAAGEVVLMDDGLQNPGLQKRLSLLVVDGATGFGNGLVFPAGRLREPVAAAARRCQAAVLIGDDATGALRMLPSPMPVHRARLVPDASAVSLAGQRVVAFAGIAFPEKFFGTLAATGADIVARHAFADHHPYTRPELAAVFSDAARLNAVPVTTAKDLVRVPPELRCQVRVLGITLQWDDPEAPETLLRNVIDQWAEEGCFRRKYDA